MQINYYPLLLILPALSAHAAPPLPQQPQQSSTTVTPQTLSAPPLPPLSPTPLIPPPISGKPPTPPPQLQPPKQPQLLLKSLDGPEISSTLITTCEKPTSASPKNTDVQALSKHYQSPQVSSLPPLALAKDKRACVPLESVPASNAKIELCGQDVFVSYSDVGKVLDMLLVKCSRGEDGGVVDGSVNGGGGGGGVAWTAGMVSAIDDGRVLFSVRVVGK
ncbi:hypothetical protein B9Z19DRAFT_1063259 [Tuber borchii]|uniref:Uncharacterized protein n=1 Tax=Tuber borchii TaxID=42251 RepID=A0A2T6ZZ22_TUBBO|nr:hypothetical protein B9Z19DRAFT_1063259 [Tuber borchii]